LVKPAVKPDFRRGGIARTVALARIPLNLFFAVSISTPAGRQYGADQFKLLLTSESSDPQRVGDVG
jgi:hypothetical protein